MIQQACIEKLIIKKSNYHISSANKKNIKWVVNIVHMTSLQQLKIMHNLYGY
jgi:hypothetical protein